MKKHPIQLLAALLLLVVAGANFTTLMAADQPSDADIVNWVKDAIHNDPRCQSAAITVTGQNGIITLTGTVPTLAARKFANRETQKIQGVRGIVDRLGVTPVPCDDLGIAWDVRRRIAESAAIESQNIQVLVMQGTVTLAGKVATLAEYLQAGLLAGEVRGVKDVQNNLTVEFRTHRHDQEIKDDALATLHRNVYLTGLPITVEVHRGVVTLAGTVGSVYEKERATAAVDWIDGVKSVKNLLTVEPWKDQGARETRPTESDAELQRAVRAALRHDSRLSSTNFAVSVGAGYVTLSGMVPDAYQGRVAVQDAQDVTGVDWVTNQLDVQPPHREDRELESAVLDAIDSDARLAGQGIQVTVQNAVATLTGKVATWYEKNHAEDVALEVRGVRTVVNELTVTRTGNVIDAELAKSIQTRLGWNFMTRPVAEKITVAVTDGVARLTGDVNNWSEYQGAERVAFHTAGVWLVENNLTIQGRTRAMRAWNYRSLSDMYDDDTSNR